MYRVWHADYDFEDEYGDYDFGMDYRDYGFEHDMGMIGMMPDDDPFAVDEWNDDPFLWHGNPFPLAGRYYREETKNMVARKWRKLCRNARRSQRLVPGFRRPSSTADRLPAGSSPLPEELWSLVFRHLATTLEPYGLRGPGVVAADIVRAGLACRDMYHGSRAGLEALVDALPKPACKPRAHQPEVRLEAPDWPRLDRAIDRPMESSASELGALLTQLGLKVPPTKPGMARRLLKYFGLQRRCSAPARLCLALKPLRRAQGVLHPSLLPAQQPFATKKLPVRHEVQRAVRDLLLAGEPAVVGALEGRRSAAEVLQQLCYAFGDTKGLLAVHAKLDMSKEGMIKRGIAARLAEHKSGALTGHATRTKYWQCPCGGAPSKACSLLLCRSCCQGHNPLPCPVSKHSKQPKAQQAPRTGAQPGTRGVTTPGPAAAGTNQGVRASGGVAGGSAGSSGIGGGFWPGTQPYGSRNQQPGYGWPWASEQQRSSALQGPGHRDDYRRDYDSGRGYPRDNYTRDNYQQQSGAGPSVPSVSGYGGGPQSHGGFQGYGGYPAYGNQQPYGGYQQPYGGYQQPYGGYQQPSDGQHQPYGSHQRQHQQAYGQRQPYGEQTQQPYGGQQPYGQQQQQPYSSPQVHGQQYEPYGSRQQYGGYQPYGGGWPYGGYPGR